MRLLVSGAQSAHGILAGVESRRGERASRDLTGVLLAASVVLVSAIATVVSVVVVIKHVHTLVQITKGHAQLRTAVLHS